jgi:hypothetical protein
VVAYVTTKLSSVRVSDAIYDPVYNSSNGVNYYANNNVSFYKDSMITIANTSYNSNGFVTAYNQIVDTNIGGGGINYRYNISYFANNTIQTITRSVV